MPPATPEYVDKELRQTELQAVLESSLFLRSPTLARLLTYLCEKLFAGESGRIKEYSIAVDVFGRSEAFDQDSDSVVRVEANRLRKRLAEYYKGEGAGHRVHIGIPVGQYVPVFEPVFAPAEVSEKSVPEEAGRPLNAKGFGKARAWFLWAAISALAIGTVVAFVPRERVVERRPFPLASVGPSKMKAEPAVAPAAGEEIRILAGSSRNYVDHSGKLWSPDSFFSGGTPVKNSVQLVWRTQDPAIYRTSRQGDFSYNIPLKKGAYELRLHFAETYYGPEEAGGGGEGSRVMTISANGRELLTDFDVLADAGGDRTADVRVFTGIVPAKDGLLNLKFSSSAGGVAMLSGIEISPAVPGHLRPVRIVARDIPYYSNDSQWWSADIYFKGGQLGGSLEPASGTDDPELYETERWGHFSYAVPVAPGKYTVVLHFIEHRSERPAPPAVGTPESTGTSEPRIFDVFLNGSRIVNHLDIRDQAGENHPLVRKIVNLEPNAQGKILLEFVPVSHYATVSAIEVLPQ